MSVAGLAKRLELERQVSPTVQVAAWLCSTLILRSRNSTRSWRFAATTAGFSASACLSYPPQSSSESMFSSTDARARLKEHRAAALPVVNLFWRT